MLQAFENTLQQWMEQFHTLLVFSCPALLASGAADVESPLDAVKAAVCQNINLFISMNEEEFAPFLPQFVQAVWTQLVTVSLNPGQVGLILSRVMPCVELYLWLSLMREFGGCPSLIRG